MIHDFWVSLRVIQKTIDDTEQWSGQEEDWTVVPERQPAGSASILVYGGLSQLQLLCSMLFLFEEV